MKQTLFFVALFVFCAFFASAQTERPRLAILPFGGGVGGQGEAFADMLSQRAEILSAFDVVPLTLEAAAIAAEHRLQMGAFVDSDLAASVGRLLGADYVLTGHTRRLGGGRNLVMAVVICVDSLELVSGYYRTYRNIHEARGFMPSMAQSLAGVTISRPTAGSLPSLAVAPIGLVIDPSDVATDRDTEVLGIVGHDLETLAQILSIEIANSGVYAVIPRASVMRTAFSAWETRIVDERAAALDTLVQALLGILDGEEASGRGLAAVTEVGRAAGTDKVLSLEARPQDGVTTFLAQILYTEETNLLTGAERGYETISEGVNRMAEIVLLLTDPANAGERIAALERERRNYRLFGDSARFWSIGVSAGSSFADPWAIGTLQGTIAPLPFLFLRFGGDVGFISDIEDAGFFSLYPFAHLGFFLPFNITPLPFRRGGLYVGAGGGFMLAEYRFNDVVNRQSAFLADFNIGINMANVIDISYTMRTNFESFNSKVSVGIIHRFITRGR